MKTSVQTQFRGSSGEQVKQHEARTLNKLSNVKAQLKSAFLKNKQTCIRYFYFPVNTE